MEKRQTRSVPTVVLPTVEISDKSTRMSKEYDQSSTSVVKSAVTAKVDQRNQW